MGTQHTTIPSPGGFGNQTSGASTQRGSTVFNMPQDGWIDKVHVYIGGNGGAHNFTFGIYRASDGALLATTQAGSVNGKQWTSLTFNLNSGNNNNGYPSPNLWLWSGYGYIIAAYGDGAADFGINAGTGTWYWHSGTGIAGNTAGWSNDPFGNNGDMYCYIEYFPPTTITSITGTPVSPGDTFDVFGTGFSSGVTDVQVNGTSCSGVSVLSDTHLQATVPSGSGGQVQVLANAGAITSSASLGVSSGDASDGTTYQSAQFYVSDGTTYQAITEVAVSDGTTYQPVSG